MAAISDKKINRGPGGWRCPCCSMYPVNIAKKHLARRMRRKNKQNLELGLVYPEL